jgi:hypothetical protein
VGMELELLRPGLVLVALGQFSFVASITTLSVLPVRSVLIPAWKRQPTTWARPASPCFAPSPCPTCVRR